MFMTLLALTPLALVEPDGSRLAESRQCYTLYRMTEAGEVPIGNTWQTVERSEHDGEPAWRIVVHQYGSGGAFDMRDEFLLAADNLAPIEFSSRFRGSRGPGHDIELYYTAQRIRGTRHEGESAKTIDVPLQNPVWEGNLWGLTFAALPLRANAHFELPFWQYDKGFGVFDVVVTGERNVELDGATVAVWIVQAGIKGGAHSEYLIAKDSHKEIGYGGAGFRQALGGDCSALSGQAAAKQ